MFALFKNWKQVSKARSTRGAVLIEAMQSGAAVCASADFPGDLRGIAQTVSLPEGYEIREVTP